MHLCPNRREFLHAAGASLLVPLVGPPLRAAAAGPSPPVGIARCKGYDPDAVLRQLEALMDRIGGLGKLVAGKTVAVKVNLVGDSAQDAARQARATGPIRSTPRSSWRSAAAARPGRGAAHPLPGEHPPDRAVRGLTSAAAGWDLDALTRSKTPVEFEDTRNLGKGKTYHEVKVPGGGSLFPAYHLNHSYVDCDVYVSLAKLKNHATAGVTLGMKNNFGVTPIALYGQHEQDEQSTSARVAIFHEGRIGRPTGCPRSSPRTRPRRPYVPGPAPHVDAVGIRPIDLVILDGIETVSGGEGPWIEELAVQEPGLLLAGRNPVCTDAVATAVMGYDPMAAPGTGPFPGDNHLAMAAALGLGTNDPKQIEVVGLSLKEARHPFGWEPRQRNT